MGVVTWTTVIVRITIGYWNPPTVRTDSPYSTANLNRWPVNPDLWINPADDKRSQVAVSPTWDLFSDASHTPYASASLDTLIDSVSSACLFDRGVSW